MKMDRGGYLPGFGKVSAPVYNFSGINREQLVDPRDAVVIVRNRLFRVEGVEEVPA